jgi:hypothetical protein
LSASDASGIRPGLPFAIFTPSLDYVPSVVLQQKDPPPQLQLTKYYFRPQIHQLQERLDEARQLGAAAVEEWYKGLDTTGQLAIAEATRFEHFEYHGGYSRLTKLLPPSGSVSKQVGVSNKTQMHTSNRNPVGQGSLHDPVSSFTALGQSQPQASSTSDSYGELQALVHWIPKSSIHFLLLSEELMLGWQVLLRSQTDRIYSSPRIGRRQHRP